MKISKRDRYSLTKELFDFTESELRDLKFSLNFRWISHMQKNHKDAMDSCKDLTNAIRAELARRVQDRHLDESLES
jgi:hypothetical protein